jgi:hypothetical protein
MEEIRGLTCTIVEDAKERRVGVTFPEESFAPRDPSAAKVALGTCPLCGGTVYENSKGFYCSNWRARGCRFTLWKQQKGDDGRPALGPEQIRTLLENGTLAFTEGTLELQKTAPFYLWKPGKA